MPRQVVPRNQLLGDTIYLAMNSSEIVVADLLAIDPDALIDPYQMRRRVQPGP